MVNLIGVERALASDTKVTIPYFQVLDNFFVVFLDIVSADLVVLLSVSLRLRQGCELFDFHLDMVYDIRVFDHLDCRFCQGYIKPGAVPYLLDILLCFCFVCEHIYIIQFIMSK